MKINEILEMSTEEIEKRIKEEENNQIDLKFQHELKQLTNTAKLKLVRVDIARMNTVLRNRQLQTAQENK
jgi:large subunit ribosomal protein L29